MTRALTLMEAFDLHETSLTLAELSRRSGMHKTTALRLARTLALSGYMVQREDGEWRLGPATGWLGARYQAGFDVNNVVEPTLRELVMVSTADAPLGMGWSRFDSLFTEPPKEWAPGVGPSAADDALILYTSGSTSKPKAVPLAHFGLIENGFNIGERQGLGAEDRVLASVPLFWAYGSANALPATFSHAAALVLQERFDSAEALALIERHRCSAIYTLPGMTAALTHDPSFKRERTQSLRTGLTIGSPQDIINAAEILGATNICNIYGSSETYGNCCVTPSHWPLARRASCQGQPLPGVTIRFAHTEAGDSADAESGLIEVSGYVMHGYLGQSAAHNAEVFTADGWYRTGDIGRLSADGDIVFVGRSTEMIKRAGINVAPAEVEDILMQHHAVAEAAVVGTPDIDKGQAIIAFVVCVDGVRTSVEELTAHCRMLASSYKVPDRIEFRDALPTTATGKPLHQALKQLALTLHGQCARETGHGA